MGWWSSVECDWPYPGLGYVRANIHSSRSWWSSVECDWPYPGLGYVRANTHSSMGWWSSVECDWPYPGSGYVRANIHSSRSWWSSVECDWRYPELGLVQANTQLIHRLMKFFCGWLTISRARLGWGQTPALPWVDGVLLSATDDIQVLVRFGQTPNSSMGWWSFVVIYWPHQGYAKSGQTHPWDGGMPACLSNVRSIDELREETNPLSEQCVFQGWNQPPHFRVLMYRDVTNMRTIVRRHVVLEERYWVVTYGDVSYQYHSEQ
jgi:hypothetical protein